jgi:hypothetical protein
LDVTIRPRLALSADGTTALVTAAAGRLATFDVGSGDLRAEHPAEHVQAAALSAAGAALALTTTAGDLLVHHDGGWLVHPLPRRAAALAISDDGARAAVLLGGRPARLELWAPGAEAPEAEAAVGGGGRGELQADGALSLLAVWLGDAPGGPAPQALLTGGLADVAGFPGPGPAAATAVHGGRAWVVSAETVTAWTADGPAGTLPGTLRDRVALAPDGGHVLLHRAEADLGGGGARVLLRAFALPGLEPAGEAEADVAGHSASALALTDALEVRAVRPTDDGAIACERIATLSR